MNWESLILLLPLGSFVAGLSATPHCAVMCGPLFVLFGEGGPGYQFGRVLAYASLGALFGALGASINIAAGELIALQNASVIVVAILFVVYGLTWLAPGITQAAPGLARWLPGFLRSPAHAGSGAGLSAWLVRTMSSLRRLTAAGERPILARFIPVLAGSLSALLPCGVLFPLWLLAAGSGTPVQGALLATGFVLGTLPGALLLGHFGRRFTGRQMHPRLRQVVGILLLAGGMVLLGVRAYHSQTGDPADPACHTPAD
jgi:hypothetical protein